MTTRRSACIFRTMKFRIEKDSLGNVNVPETGLYGAQTVRALENYQISGRTAHPELIRAYLFLKKSAAEANLSSGVLPKALAEKIARAVDELLLRESEWPQIFPVDPYQAGAGTSQNMCINEVIANVANGYEGAPLGTYAPIHPNDHVNCSQSTNDTFPTAMRIALLFASKSLESEIRALSESFLRKSKQWMTIPKSARTHLQDAVPMTLGQEFSGYGETLAKVADWVTFSREQLRVLGIGGTAAGTGINAPKNYRNSIVGALSKNTGEKLISASNLFEAMQSQSPVGLYSSMMRLMATELTRICNDLRLLASGPMTGLAEINLPAVQPGSSIMPGKVNPSILEMANQAMFSVIGYDQTISQCLMAGQLELNVMMPMMVYSALEATRISTRAVKTLREKCVDGLEPNEEKLKHYFESTPQIATALSPLLGYEKTAELVKEALKNGVSVVSLIKERNLIPATELEKLLNITALTSAH